MPESDQLFRRRGEWDISAADEHPIVVDVADEPDTIVREILAKLG